MNGATNCTPGIWYRIHLASDIDTICIICHNDVCYAFAPRTFNKALIECYNLNILQSFYQHQMLTVSNVIISIFSKVSTSTKCLQCPPFQCTISVAKILLYSLMWFQNSHSLWISFQSFYSWNILPRFNVSLESLKIYIWTFENNFNNVDVNHLDHDNIVRTWG